MKITPSQLKKIIAEEVQKVINEGSMTADPELMLIDSQLNGDSELANKVLALMNPLPYMQAIEEIKTLSENMPGKFNDALLKLRKES
jgi:hypothetical protein